MSKIKYFIEQSWLLIVAAFCFGLLIAVTNAGLFPIIEQNKIDKLKNLMSGLMPKAEEFVYVKTVQINSPKGKLIDSDIYKALNSSDQTTGWAFNASGPGFADKIELVVAVGSSFTTIQGFDVLSSNETPGFGDRIKTDYFRDQFEGAPASQLALSKIGDPAVIDKEIVAISGATVSSEAVVDLLNNALVQIKEKMDSKGQEGNGEQ